MKKGLVIFIVVLGLGLLIASWVTSIFNKIVGMEEAVTSQWAIVESSYQRRADLIPNLVSTVKGYAEFEKSTLEGVIEARSRATRITVDPNKTTPEELAKYQQAQDGVSSALSRLLAVVENYPDLKANQNFLELQSQLEGTENRINIERNKFNEEVKQYNTTIRRFPANVLNGFFGFEEKGYFKAAEGSENAPKVEF
jgi:LemA protein